MEKDMKKHVFAVLLVIGSIMVSTVQAAEFSVGRIFSDHMVLQQGRVNTIWGWGDPDARVTIRVDQQDPITVKAQSDGYWSAELPAMDAGMEAHVILLESNGSRIEINDVLVGEVWFCSGQSNMQWTVRSCDGLEEFKADANRPGIRMFTVALTSVNEPAKDVIGEWRVCSPETVENFSGTAYHLGRGLSDELDVPIGLISSSWGGSSAEAWISEESLATVEPGRRVIRNLEEMNKANSIDRKAFNGMRVDQEGWTEGSLPGDSKAFGIPDAVDGIFWIRIPMEIPKHWTGRPIRLSLGKIDDDDVTYFNGQKVGATRGWQAMRNYEVPGNLVSPGPSVLAIEITDGAGPGGLHSGADELFAHPVDDPEDRLSLAGPASMIVAAEVRNMPAQHKPAHLYNGMLHPLRDYGLAGAAWYQGENNAIGAGRAEEYEILLPMLINDWRSLTGHEDLPFLIVQLPNWDHKGGNWNYPRLRETQRLTHERVLHTGLAITTDIGDANDIHPRNKHDVGDRLARWALVDVYGRSGLVKSGPLPDQVSWGPEGVEVSFKTFGSPLAVRGGNRESGSSVAGFELMSIDGSMIPVSARIIADDRILIPYPDSGGPWSMIRYAWKPDPTDAELCNAVGLPASPFEYPGSGLD